MELITESIDAQSFPSLLAAMTERHLEKFNVLLPILNNALEIKEIYNVDFKEAKDLLNRAIEQAGSNLVKKEYLNKYQGVDSPEGASEAYYAQWSLHLLPSVVKKLSKFKDDEIVQKALALAAELMPLSVIMKELKPYIIKGRKPNPNAKKTEVYVPPPSARADIKQVSDTLIELTAGIREELFTQSFGRIELFVTDFQAKKRDNPRLTIRDIRSPEAVMYIQRLLDFRTSERVPDYEELKNKMAQQSADDMIEGFIFKNTKKLSSIVGKKGNLKDILILQAGARNGTIEGRLKITFDDSSEFQVDSKVVYSYSTHGTTFMRYPTTFHNIIMSDGSKLRPSEKNMNEIFVV